MDQGTQEWKEARLGCVTASRVSDVIARTKSGYGASRANYAAQLIAERLTGVVTEGFVNAEMQWGTDTEDSSRAAYEFQTGIVVEQVGFIMHPSIQMTGASPDGFAGDDGLLECKCPNTATHIETLISGKIAEKYLTQMHWQMACTGRKWCDFVSFDPRMPEHMQLFVQRVKRDDARIDELEREVVGFLAEIDERIKILTRKYPKIAEAA